MKNNDNDEKTNVEFKSPKLPFAWLASSFILPLAILVLPPLLTDAEMSWEHRTIIALALFSAFLLVSCIAMAYGRYEEAYARQVIHLKLKDAEERIKNTERDLQTLEQREKFTNQSLELNKLMMKELSESVNNLLIVVKSFHDFVQEKPCDSSKAGE